MKAKSTSRLVYSSDSGRLCPDCQQPRARCKCTPKSRQSTTPTASDGIVRIRRETKGRKGKGVSLVCGLTLNEADLKQLAKRLKQLCGTGGTVKDGTIEIQGDHRDLLFRELQQLGYQCKIAGG